MESDKYFSLLHTGIIIETNSFKLIPPSQIIFEHYYYLSIKYLYTYILNTQKGVTT